MFLIGDVVPPNVPAISDAFALLRFGAGNGFFLAALTGLVRTVFSDYWQLRTKLGLTRYSEQDMTARLAQARFRRNPRAKQPRPSPLAHDVPRAAGRGMSAAPRI